MSELTDSEKLELDYALKRVQNELVYSVNPDSIRDGIKTINNINTDGNKNKISRDEVVNYLAHFFHDKPPGLIPITNSRDDIKIEAAQEICTAVGMYSHLSKPDDILDKEATLVPLGDIAMQGIRNTRNAAILAKAPEARELLSDTFAKKAFAIFNSKYKNSIPSDSQEEALKYVSVRTRKIGMETVQSIEDSLKDQDIKRGLLKLPNLSEFNITADHICQALTPPAPEIKSAKRR